MKKRLLNISFIYFRPIFLFCSTSLCLFLIFCVELYSRNSLRDEWIFKAKESLILNKDKREVREAHKFRMNKRKANQHTQLNGRSGFLKFLNQIQRMESLRSEVEEILMLIPDKQRQQLVESFPKSSPNRDVAGANILKLHESPVEYFYFN